MGAVGNKKPPVEHQIKKGEVRNPLGAGAHNPVVKALRRMSQDDIAEIGTLIVGGQIDKLKDVAFNPESTVLQVWIAAVAIKAIEKGDAQALSIILDRIAGKVKENVDVTVSAKLSDEDLIERARILTKQIEDKNGE